MDTPWTAAHEANLLSCVPIDDYTRKVMAAMSVSGMICLK
jgi:hypothetical protein